MMKKSLLDTLSTDQILDMKLSELPLSLKGSCLEKCTKQLGDELAAKGLLFRPHFWISTEWFSPDGVPGIAIPFFLLHPKLQEIEKSQIGHVEGQSYEHCMKLLRHEAGHAIDNAFGLRKNRARQALFGLSSTPYPKSYGPRAFSKSFVNHLGDGYAQAHPDEDWAETFATWLDPKSRWQKRYAFWPCIKKLDFINDLMSELILLSPKVKCRDIVSPLSDSNLTLRGFYKRRRKNLRLDHKPLFKRELGRIFDKNTGARIPANRFIRAHKKHFVRTIAKSTNEYQYNIKSVVDSLIKECGQNRYSLKSGQRHAKQAIEEILIRKSKRYLKEGYHRKIM